MRLIISKNRDLDVIMWARHAAKKQIDRPTAGDTPRRRKTAHHGDRIARARTSAFVLDVCSSRSSICQRDVRCIAVASFIGEMITVLATFHAGPERNRAGSGRFPRVREQRPGPARVRSGPGVVV